MRREFRRNAISVSSYVVLEALFIRSVLRIDFENLQNIKVIQVVNTIGALVVAVMIIRFVFLPYIIVFEKSMIIKHAFTSDSFSISEILDANVDDGYFLLKNGKKIKFNSFMLTEKNLKSLKSLLHDLRVTE